VCIALCTIIVAHNTAQNTPDNIPPYPTDNHHSSNDDYLREWEAGNSLFIVQSDKSVKQDNILVWICGVTLTKLAVIHRCQWRSRVHPSPKLIWRDWRTTSLTLSWPGHCGNGVQPILRLSEGCTATVANLNQKLSYPRESAPYAVTRSRHFFPETFAKTQVSRHEMSQDI